MKKSMLLSLIVLLSFVCSTSHAIEGLQVTGPESAAKITYQAMEKDQVLVSVFDSKESPIQGLQVEDFAITKDGRNSKILSVVPLETDKDVAMNIVLVVDNSFSMKQRRAIEPMLSALDEFLNVVRPMDSVHAIVFDDKETIEVKGKNLNARLLKENSPDALRSFFRESFGYKITNGTYLYEGMFLGLDILRQMPADSYKFLLVFTDGEDINSTTRTPEVEELANAIPNFSAYAVDFTRRETKDSFLMSFSEAHNGMIWKAASAEELVPRFQALSKALLHQYVVTYRFLNPPEGTLALEPTTVIIEEVTTIDSSPLLNYVFFDEGQSNISGQYVLLSNQSEAGDFSEMALSDPLEKYRNILNIIGKRLMENPGARITLVGCNSNLGVEKSNMDLSRGRAESVQGYLKNVWGIDASRMEVKVRNLPKTPSTSAKAKGIAENQRVEIHSADAAVLDIIKSTYVSEVANPEILSVKPQIQSEAGIANWKVDLRGEDKTVIDSASGTGDMTSAVKFNLHRAGASKIASFKTLTASVEVTDKEGESFKNETAATTNVQFMRREAMRAQRKGERILEKYALILFEYDSADIKERNKLIVDRIVARMKELPSAEVRIVGHTDIIGSEEYNIKLSERRAKAVYDQLVAAGIPVSYDMTHVGVGPSSPLYDNASPEGRALNRTVTVTLMYDEQG